MNLDPVTLQVVWNSLVTTTEEMSINLQRSAYSSNIKTRRDHSCAMFDDKMRSMAQAHDQPAHLGLLTGSVPIALREFGPEDLMEGDMIVLNDPSRGSAHLPDVTLIAPVYHKKRHFGYVVNLAHHQDIGGMTPGSVPGNATEIWQEGLILPVIKLVSKGDFIDDVLKLILANVRGGRDRLGDYRAQIAANNYGILKINGILDKYGEGPLREYLEEIMNYTERAVRRELINKVPDGTYKAEDYLDNDGIGPEPIKISVSITVKNGSVDFDFTGTDKQTRGALNSNTSCLMSACAFVVKCITDPNLPINAGFYRPIKVIAPDGLVVSSKRPAAVGGTWEVVQRCVDAILKAFSEVIPTQIPAAGKGIICNLSFGGKNPRTGDVYAFYEAQGGGFGGRVSSDGPDAVQYMIHNTENTPIEELETILPLRIENYALIPDSGGAGTHRGGFGIRRDYKFVDHQPTFSILADRAVFAPWGLFGGLPAERARFLLNPGGKNEKALNSKTVVRLGLDDTISIQTPGGGGYGHPYKRPAAKVLADVQDGLVSVRKAKEDYGVAIVKGRTAIKVDEAATKKLRRRRRA